MTRIVTMVAYMAVPFLIAVYTLNYGRLVGRQGNRRGAWGLYFLAVLTAIVPLAVLLMRVEE